MEETETDAEAADIDRVEEREGLTETQAEAAAKDDRVVIQEAKGTLRVAQVVQLSRQVAL